MCLLTLLYLLTLVSFITCKKMKRNTIRKKSEKIDMYRKRKGKNDLERNK